MFKGIFRRKSDDKVIAEGSFDTELELFAWRDENIKTTKYADATFTSADVTAVMNAELLKLQYKNVLEKVFYAMSAVAIADGVSIEDFEIKLMKLFKNGLK